MSIYVVFIVLLGILILWKTGLLSSFNFSSAKDRLIGGMGAISRLKFGEWVKSFAIAAIVWVSFLAFLYVFREETPFWNKWSADPEIFWMSQLSILLISLVYSTTKNKWYRVTSLLTMIVVLWNPVGEYLKVMKTESEVAKVETIKSTPKVITEAEAEVLAPVGKYSDKVILPLYSSFRIKAEGKVKIRTASGSEVTLDPEEEGPRIELGVQRILMFSSAGDEPVKVTIITKRL